MGEDMCAMAGSFEVSGSWRSTEGELGGLDGGVVCGIRHKSLVNLSLKPPSSKLATLPWVACGGTCDLGGGGRWLLRRGGGGCVWVLWGLLAN